MIANSVPRIGNKVMACAGVKLATVKETLFRRRSDQYRVSGIDRRRLMQYIHQEFIRHDSGRLVIEHEMDRQEPLPPRLLQLKERSSEAGIYQLQVGHRCSSGSPEIARWEGGVFTAQVECLILGQYQAA